MKPYPVLLLFGLDSQTLPVDAEVTRHMIARAEQVLRERAWRVAASEVTDDLDAALAPFAPAEWLVFNLCEGSPNQPFYYASVARELERRGFAYTGCDADALHRTQFKPMMKRMLEARRLPTPRWTAVECVEELSFDLFPALVKPAGEHCSFGITRESVVFTLAEARAQAATVMEQYPGGAIIEEFLDGEEYGISLWGNHEDLEVFGISVIRYDALPDLRDRLCTFDAKWLPETEAYQKTMPTCPAPLSPALKDELEVLACRAHIACGVRDYSRIDIRMQDRRPMVLDVNGNCALSENSGFVETARIAGWDYATLLDRLVSMAASRASALPAGTRIEARPQIQTP
jgi:D-alanine-D-alanine ligase